MKKRTIFILFTLALLMCLFTAFATAETSAFGQDSRMFESARPSDTAGVVMAKKSKIQGKGLAFEKEDQDRDDWDPDALFKGFIRQQMGKNPSAQSTKTAYDRLKNLTAAVYRYLVPELYKVATGQRASTRFTIPMKDLGYGDRIRWTAADLGVDHVAYNDAFWTAFNDRVAEIFSSNELDYALMFDVPFELYWSSGCGGHVEYDINVNDDWVDLTGVEVRFHVYSEYQDGDEYTMNTNIGATVVNAGNKARAIVAKYKDASDYEKMRGYSKEICELVDYNYDAYEAWLNGEYPSYDPYHLLWVFDGDPTTNVVCNGYAEAFQHLCNLTNFKCKTIQCNTVRGYTQGWHTWNVVQMDDGKNYMVDVTWADAGWGNRFVLKEADEGTYPKYKHNGYWREYDEETMDLYGEKKLAISNQKYVPLGLSIEAQPKDVTVKSGAKAKFTVKVKAKEVTYQWYSKAPNAAEWTALNGETKNTLTVVGSGANNGCQYCCRVKNSREELYSNAAKLTVTLDVPMIKTQPKSITLKSGAKGKFTVKASGKNLQYKWYSRPNADADWAVVAGETKATLNIVGAMDKNGTQYRCVIKNADGEVTSATATLTVTKEIPVIKTQPKSVTVKSGAKGKFTVKASGKNLSYKWFSRPNANADWTEIAGETKATLNIVGSMDKNGWEFCCEVQNPDGKVRSNPAKLTVTSQAPKISTQPKDVKAKVGAKATFKVKASPKNVTYQWYYRTSETGEWIKIEGATSASYSFKVTEAQYGYQFRCHVQNADGEAWSKAATLLRK